MTVDRRDDDSRGLRAVYVLSVAVDDIVERLGAEVADQLHRTIVESLKAMCRDQDDITTVGGSLLTISLDDIADDAMADRIGSRLYRAAALAADTVAPGAGQLIRMGGARCQEGESVSEASRHATSALRATTGRGRPPVRSFSPADRRHRRRELTVEETVRDAVRGGLVTPHFQPIVELDGGTVAGFEALARIEGTDAPSPAEFIPAAERLGLIGPLSALVSRKAFEAAADWPEHTRISINVSDVELPDPRFVDRLTAAARRCNLHTGDIVLEITESVLVNSSAVTSRQIEALHAAGFRLAIDDYGAGHSSLKYLSEWPISLLKLDHALTHTIGEPRSDIVLRSQIDLANDLGIAVIGEGIETPAQADALRAWGCRFGQGYLLGRPTPSPQFTRIDGAAA
ncbi:MAG: EAL domain-containing protein [Acidimicrobiales bacterium]